VNSEGHPLLGMAAEDKQIAPKAIGTFEVGPYAQKSETLNRSRGPSASRDLFVLRQQADYGHYAPGNAHAGGWVRFARRVRRHRRNAVDGYACRLWKSSGYRY
jgi:hypothetical protein